MKKYLLIFLFISSYTFSQSNGITYQAVIYNPRGEQLPGANNPYSLITNQQVCIQFGIVDANGSLEYQENVQVVTDGFGMVNVLIGAYTQTAGYATGFNNVNWGPEAKFLKVDIAIKGECAEFEELSYQPFTYVPFAYYSPASDIPGPQGIQGEVGPQGATGATGAQGIQGEVGPQGATGATGAQGIQGEVGPQGPAGTNGTNGSDGATGATGPQGATGAQGIQGEIGPLGATGATGAQGIQGEVGPQGVTGATGAQGIQGEVGTQGIQGATGTQGAQGEVGPQGETGATGAQGEVGPQGQTGATGAQGIQGEVGPQGLAGTNGTNGSDGATGATGAQGIQGEVGPQGLAGTNGTNGSDGATGATGAQGVQGEVGPQGATGTTGAQGIQGEIGPLGATGATGAQGIQGEVGPQGATGATGAQGIQGEVGPQGATGATGIQGEVGPQGETGATGAQGIQGDVGPQGETGATGAQGIQGEVGSQGATGATGTQGIQGEVGFQGATGATGAQGPAGTNGTNGADGATGATGPQGSTGLTGPQGSPGINGENGQDGINGLSAYEIWISLGNTGTEQEFIDSLVGPASSGGNSGSANFTNGIPSSIDEYTSCNDEDSCNLLIQDGWVPFGGISIDESRAGTGGNTYSYGVRQAMIKYENSPTIDAYRIAVSIQEVTDDIADGFIPYGGVSYTESRAGTGGRNFSKKEYQAMILLSSENENTNDSSSSSDSIVAEHISPIEDYNWDIPGWEFDAMGEGTSLIKSRITNNSITFYPIFVSKQTDYSALGFFRGSSSNNTSNVNNIDIRIGIFSFSNGKPGELVKEFDLINYSTLPRFFEVETFFSLNAGNYFVGVTSETQGLQSYSDFYNVVRNANEGQTFGISPNGTLSKMSVVNGSSYLETGDSYIYSKNSSQVGFGNIDSANFIQMTNSGFIFFKQVL